MNYEEFKQKTGKLGSFAEMGNLKLMSLVFPFFLLAIFTFNVLVIQNKYLYPHSGNWQRRFRMEKEC